MGTMIDDLYHLQTIETKLRSLRGQIESKRRVAQAFGRKLTAGQSKAHQISDEITKAQTEADRLELDRKQHEEHVNKLREALNKAKSNKDYAAILTELNTNKANAMKLEDVILAGLSRVDELKKQLADGQAVSEKGEVRLEELEDATLAVEDRLASRIRELEALREKAADTIPPQALHAFERACGNYDGEAMAQIAQPHPRRTEYVCGGCNMSIPLEIVNALQSRDDLQVCSTCSRILYLNVPSEITPV